jgi:hypothetical protein
MALPKPPRPVPAPKPMDPNKAIMAAPRMKPIEARNYGKGITPMSAAPTMPKGGPLIPKILGG